MLTSDLDPHPILKKVEKCDVTLSGFGIASVQTVSGDWKQF